MTTPDDTVPPPAPPAKTSPATARARQRADLLARVALVCGQLADVQIEEVIRFALTVDSQPCPQCGWPVDNHPDFCQGVQTSEES